MNSGIYIIRNEVNKKFYLGSTINFNSREMSHYHDLKNNKHHSIKLQRAWNKYGEKNFKFYIFFRCAISVLKDVEQFYLDLYKPYIHGYNVSNSSRGYLGELPKQIKKKIGKSLKGKKLSEETKKKISEGNKGKIVSDKTRRKISEANKGKKHSEETKQKISEANKGKKITEETRKKLSESHKNYHIKVNERIHNASKSRLEFESRLK